MDGEPREYSSAAFSRAQLLGCDEAESALWGLIAARRGLGDDELAGLEDEIRVYTAARRRGERTRDDLAALLEPGERRGERGLY